MIPLRNTWGLWMTKRPGILFYVTCFLIVAAHLGCQQTPIRGGKSPTKVKAQQEDSQFGDEGGSVKNTKSEESTALPVPKDDEARVAVILGPGGYKSFAHVGVVKELRKAGIPIHKVIGIEWGALVGALFSQRGQTNEAEWKLYKLEKLDLNKTSFFSSKGKSTSVADLRGYLKENLKDNSRPSVNFECPSLRVGPGILYWPKISDLATAVESCLSYPPLLETASIDVAGAFAIRESVARLKNENYNVIILVNVLGDGPVVSKEEASSGSATQILWDEIRRQIWQAKSEVTDFIDVPTKGFSLTSFSSRKLLMTAGEAAGESAAKNIANKYGY